MKKLNRILSFCLAWVMLATLTPAGMLIHASAANGSAKMTTGQELYIFLAKDMTYRWNINDSGTGKNQVCHLDYNSGENCRFVLGNETSSDGETWYSIKHTKAKYYLDVESNNSDDNKVLHQNSTDPNQNNRRFCFIPVPKKANTYYIKAKHSGSYVSLQNGDGNPSRHQKVAQRKDSPTEWYIVPAGNQSAPRDMVTNYLQKGDYFTVQPAEKKYQNDSSTSLAYTTYALSAQDDNTANGNDVQMYEIGTTKWCVMRESNGRYQIGYSNFEESTAPGTNNWNTRFWDIENVSVNPGTNVHMWEDDNLNDDNKLFFLQEDNDGDPETFYICNDLAWKHYGAPYLAPRGYYDGSSPEANGRNTELTFNKFRWRVQIINREATTKEGTTVEASWMQNLPDDMLLSNVNMPGTHDTCTANAEKIGVQGANNVVCQRYFVDEQLIAGIRAMDLRYTIHGDKVIMCHGSYGNDALNKGHDETYNGKKIPANGKLELFHVLEMVRDFLSANPTETVILILKQDDGPSNGPEMMANVVTDPAFKDCYYDWSNPNPTVGDVRGKIVLMTRSNVYDLGLEYETQRMFGPNLTGWDENYKDNHHFAQAIDEDTGITDPDGNKVVMPKVFVQDDYNSSDGQKQKWVENVIKQMNGKLSGTVDDFEVETVTNADFVFNYTSKAYGDDIVNPLFAARTMNNFLMNDKNMIEYFGGGYRTGITMVDFADKSLAHYIIHSNTGRQSGSQQSTTLPTFSVSNSATQYQLDTLLPEDFLPPEANPEKLVIEQEGNENLVDTAEPGDDDGADMDSEPSVVFDDCSEDDLYYDAITEAAEEGYVNGIGNGKFAPDGKLNRSMLVQILYNLDGKPETSSGNFSDIRGREWFAKAASWAQAHGLVTDGSFTPGRLVTREEISVMLYGYAQRKGYDTSATADLSVFSDAEMVSADAQAAMAWAVANGIMEGSDSGLLAPQENITRAETAQILVNFVHCFVK